jgi:hypothetical protein
MVHFHISAKKNKKLACWTPLAANRSPNRMEIRMENRFAAKGVKQVNS